MPVPGTKTQIFGAPTGSASAQLASQQGVVLESAVPYKNNDDLIISAGEKPLYYSPEGDWSVPEEKRFNSALQLQESNNLPVSQVGNALGGSAAYAYNPSVTTTMKKAIMKTGAVEISYCADQSAPDEITGNSEYFNYATHAQYTDKVLPSNHSVAIVGWDDTFAKDKFKAAPPEDGAWIVKNSWGSKDAEFPNINTWGVEGSGYFYLSYYDQTVASVVSFDMATKPNEQYEHIYQHDYIGKSSVIDGTMTAPKGTGIASANVFTAAGNQTLRAASVETVTPGSEVLIEVYRLFENAKNPTDGELVGKTEASPEFAGYHRIALDTSQGTYDFYEGQKFSVIETVTGADGSSFASFERGISSDVAANAGHDRWQNVVIHPGESFFYADGQWSDAITLNNDAEKTFGGEVLYGNVLIKAFADDANLPPIEPRTLSLSDNTATVISAETAAKTAVSGTMIGADPRISLTDLPVQSDIPALFKQSLEQKDPLLFSYDLSLKGVTGLRGPLQVTLPIGDEYNGKNVKALHFVAKGELDRTGVAANENIVDRYDDLVVKNGTVTVTSYSLSPFGIALTGNSGSGEPTDLEEKKEAAASDEVKVARMPKVGDSLSWLPLFLFPF